ncbi:hypothetical protein [Pseudomonas sp. PAMC 25886]|jgi:hypothetical protein|uniref:hypothetical protein n=1 Tax=Pseudomonas sp. PAMC 25886 TaxID=1125977 RepID=UPI0002890375|nr:hypothetical protein [Pseudomonas sp. PAMC 25886]
MALSLSGIHPGTFWFQGDEQLLSPASPGREEAPARYVQGVKVSAEPDKQSHYGVSLKKNGEKPDDIANAFTATERVFGEFFDVSSHAAVIKMMMLKFGRRPLDVFDQVKPTADGYKVTMKDGFHVGVTHEELKLAAQASRFTGKDAGAVKDANFILAAFVKRKQLQSGTSFNTALKKTVQGETPHNLLKGMGMIGFMQYVSSDFLQGNKAVGVMATHNFGASLVLGGVKYNYQKQEGLDKAMGYRLTGDETLSNELLVNPGKDTVQLSSVPVGVKPVNIWSGFYQGMEGNCVTVSAMKAAMMKLGQNPAGIYKHISATEDGYAVVMRDGFRLRVTHKELKKAEQHSHLDGTDKVLLKDANFLYAVSAKRAQLENHEGRAAQSFEVAMETLNNGEAPEEGFRRLGLYAFTRPSTAQELADGALGVMSNFWHSVVAVNGAIDLYGSKESLAPSIWNDRSSFAIKLV